MSIWKRDWAMNKPDELEVLSKSLLKARYHDYLFWGVVAGIIVGLLLETSFISYYLWAAKP